MANTLIWIPKRLVETSLLNVAALETKAFADYCENEYIRRINSAAQMAVDSGAKVIMLSGPSASGKTTTAHKVSNRLKDMGHNSVVISLDCFFKNIDEYPRLPDGTPDYESVDALDIEGINRAVFELSEKGETDIPDFDFANEKRTRTINHIKLKDGIAVIEGIHALNPRLTSSLPHEKVYKIYAGLREEYSLDGQRILPTRDIRLVRRMVRDVQFRGHTIEKTIGMWGKVCDGEDKYIKAYKNDADMLLDTSFSYEPNVLAPFIQQYKKDIDKQSPVYDTFISLCKAYESCKPIDTSFVPTSSILREFLGGADEQY